MAGLPFRIARYLQRVSMAQGPSFTPKWSSERGEAGCAGGGSAGGRSAAGSAGGSYRPVTIEAFQ
jgi:hypothetical protein